MALTRTPTDMIVDRVTGKKLNDTLAEVVSNAAYAIGIVKNINMYKLPAETEYTQAMARAIADLPNGGRIEFPAGTFTVNDISLPSKIMIKGAGRDATRIERNKDNPVFKVVGTPLPTGGQPSHQSIAIEDVTIASNGTFGSDLTSFQGVTGMDFQRIKLIANECRLVYTNQMWDSRFRYVEFFNGGRDDGTPSLELASGWNGYQQSQEIVIDNCHFESYKGSAIRTQRDSTTSFKTGNITISNTKFESKLCTGNHLNLEMNNSHFSKIYVTTEFSTTDVIKMTNCRGIQGDISFFYVTNNQGGQTPQSLVNIDSNGYLIDLRILVREPQPAGANVITLANISEPTIKLDIVAAEPRINGAITSMGRMGKAAIWMDSGGKPRISASKPSNLDSSGYGVMRQLFGNTSQRPSGLTANDAGLFYYDQQVGKPIWWNGTSWRDATGVTV